MNILHQFKTRPQSCSYLPGKTCELEYTVARVLSPSDYEQLMDAGCRKFGVAIFRPTCPDCNLCRPIRFSVHDFRPDRSQRRVLKRNADLEVRIGKPSCDMGRLRLFKRYHQAQEQAKNWYYQDETAAGYDFNFVQSQIPGTEISVWENNVLRGVLLTEDTPNVISAVYHYYDPDWSGRSIGTFLILKCAEYAREHGRRWLYLGYYIQGCASMEYKKRFRPYEIMGPDGSWQRNS